MPFRSRRRQLQLCHFSNAPTCRVNTLPNTCFYGPANSYHLSSISRLDKNHRQRASPMMRPGLMGSSALTRTFSHRPTAIPTQIFCAVLVSADKRNLLFFLAVQKLSGEFYTFGRLFHAHLQWWLGHNFFNITSTSGTTFWRL